MPTSPLETAGAAIQPTAAAPLHTNEFFTGLWTNGSPLGPGAVPYLYAKFYSAMRYDRLVDGNDIEISPRLTLIRRPGHTVYNPGPFPPINRFYEFRGFTATDEVIRLLADCDDLTVRDVTQPATNTTLWNKTAGAGRTSFVSNGNVLYAGDGKSTHKWVTSGQSWQSYMQPASGDFIIDSNGNIEQAVGNITANITHIQVIDAGGGWVRVFLFFDPNTPLVAPNGIYLDLSGLTTVPSANLQTYNNVVIQSSVQCRFDLDNSTLGIPLTPYSAETGTAKTFVGTGNAGFTQPAWAMGVNQITLDYQIQWVNKGSAAQAWGPDAPTTAPTVTQTAAPSAYHAWAANTWYAPPGAFVIVDSNNNLQQLTTAGITKTGSPPVWATAPGTTADGTCVWTFKGSGAWTASTAHAVGDLLVATYTYYITDTYFDHILKQWITTSIANTTTSLFRCTTAGITGTFQPSWTNGLLTTTQDGSVVWTNGGTPPGWPGTAQTLSLDNTILDSLGHLEVVQNLGESGATMPAWASAQGAQTHDNGINWLNNGSYSAGNTGAWIYAYSGKNSITGDISTASPLSQPIVVSAGNLAVIQGQGLPDPPSDTIVLWRTVQGGSQLLYDDEFPNPGAGQTWVYTDTNADPLSTDASGTPQPGQLNFLITAPINDSNDPPPANFVPEAYYLGRIWGYTNNVLRWTGGPDTVAGNGDATMPPVNQFRLPSKGILCWPTTVGLICFTSTDIWVVLGQGTDNSPFYVVNFQQGIGMASSDAFAVNGSTAFALLTSHQLVSIDPGAGELEIGFPIADLLDTQMDPANTYVTWHQGRSADTALYVANGSAFWYRMAAVSAPESGNVWSPAAVIHSPGQVRATASVEITPGEKVFVVGPNVDGNPILMRDRTVNSDDGVAFAAHATIAPTVLSQPGSTAGVQFVVVEEKMVDGASAITVKMLFDEFHDFTHILDADWRTLRNRSFDPPNLPKQKSVLTQRLWAQQDPSTVIRCRFYQQDLSWPAEDFGNELYTNTIYGRLPEKARK